MPGHDGDFGARQQLFDFSQQVRAGKARQLQVGDDNVGRRRFSRRERGFGCLRLRANEIQTLADRHAQAADALFIVHDQESEGAILLSWFPYRFLDRGQQFVDAEGFFNARCSVLREQTRWFRRWPCRR